MARPRPVASKPSEPERTLGPYRLGELLRAFEVFTTHRALHGLLGREVWITAVAPSKEPSELDRQRLVEAARIASTAGLDVALPVLELAEEGGRVAIVEEAPRAPSLAALTAESSQLSLEARIAIAVEAALRVGRLHERGIIHAALAPQFLFAGPDGVRVGHLLSARRSGQPRPDWAAADTALHGEEVRYESPEQSGSEEPTPASDVFSLGVIAAELVTGRHPFDPLGAGGSVARALRTAEPEVEIESEDPSLGRAVAAVLRRAMSRIPTLRYPNAADFGRDLASVLGGEAIASELYRGSTGETLENLPHEPRAVRARSSSLTLRLGGVAALMVLVAGLGHRSRAASPSQAAVTAAVGSVRVLARPWAEVYVDGRLVDTTPIGRPLALAPGSHEIVLRHPNAPEHRRRVDLAPGGLVTVDVEFAIDRPAPSGSASSP